MASIGFGRTRPGTNNLHEYVCFIRHALALDEIRVKFLPEYLFGGNPIPDDVAMKLQDGIEKVKEVWFSGSHSDVYVDVVACVDWFIDPDTFLPIQWRREQA